MCVCVCLCVCVCVCACCVHVEHALIRVCTQLGTPFCQTHSGCPIHNLMPEFNELVFKEQWKTGQLCATMYVYMSRYVCIYYVCISVHVYIVLTHVYIYACMHAYMHTHTHDAYIRTYIHTYIHTYRCWMISLPFCTAARGPRRQLRTIRRQLRTIRRQVRTIRCASFHR